MNAYWKYAQSTSIVLLASILLMITVVPLQAAANKGSLEIREKKGFARLIFTFDRQPEYSSQTISTVFVVKFKKPVSVDLGPIVSKLPNVVTIARRDPDGYGLRFAMVRDFKVNVMRAGNHLIVDFLSKSWRGRPPGIPQEIVDKLAKEAEKARLAAQERARQEAMQIAPLQVEVHHARQPTFNRIQFDWNRFVTAQFTRKGDDVTVTFGGRAMPDLAHLKIKPPENLKQINYKLGKNDLKIFMQVSKGTKVRAFREGQNYVIDLTITKPQKLSEIEKSLYAAAEGNKPDTTSRPMEEITLVGEREEEQQKSQKAIEARKKTSETKAKTVAISAPESKTPLVKKNIPTTSKKLPGTVQLDGDVKRGNELSDKKAGLSSKTVRGSFNPGKKEQKSQTDQRSKPEGNKSNKISVKRNENSVQLSFPFQKKQISAAIFQRNKYLSILIDSPKKLDLAGLRSQLGGIVNDIRHEKLENSQLFEFYLSGPWLSSVSQHSPNWTLSIGDLVTGSSKKFKPVKQINGAGVEEVFIPTSSAGRLHQIKDMHSGDDLMVVTSPGPARSIKKRHDHVEFQLFGTIHGIVVRPLSDDLRVTKNRSGVKIAGPKGLYLSGNIQKVATKAEQPHNKRRNKARNLKFNDIKAVNISQFSKRTLDLEKQIATKSGRERSRLRLDLVQHWLSRELAPEAIGMLGIVASENVEIIKDPVFRLMRGISNVMLRRYKVALVDLKTSDLEDNAHASLWRGLASYKQKKFERAVAEFKRGEAAIKTYSPRQQAMFRLAGAEAAIERKNPVLAGAQLDSFPEKGATKHQGAMSRFLEGRLMELQNRPKEALQLYADATKANIRPVTARAVFYLTDLRLRIGEIKPQTGVGILERLSIVWRGDDVELQILHRLADLYLQKGRYSEAFSLMETAVKAYPTSEAALALQDRMRAQFEELFLQGKADKMQPIKALALFYDHKRLTPPGRLGDEMIRRLADRLINVDLLDKAADLLEHQVTRRLKGAGRAQVAIRLAMIHLLQRRPKLALKTIYRTRQSRLPKQVRQARKLLEARAYAELGRSGPALELLANDETDEAGEIRSLALWNGKKWTKAGEQYEKVLGAQWQASEALSSKARVQVLRAAISYTLGGDKLGVQRLRDKYAAKMAGGADAEAFAMITDPLKTNSKTVDRLARDIADIDTLEAFIKAFRQKLETPGGPQTTSTIE